MITLAAFEKVIDASGTAARIEAMLPVGVRPRQLRVRTLLAGMCLAQADDRPAHLTRVHQALTTLREDDQRRLGVIADWKHGPHLLTYRQTERTFGLVADALARDEPDGLPSGDLAGICDSLLEASVPDEFKDASTSLAVDWTDMESFSRPPPAKGGPCADPEASWGHRKNNLLRSEDELFYGYYLSAGIMMRDENGPAVPELARRVTLSSCRHDPVRAFAPVLTAMPEHGIPLGDILADSGYAHRDAGAWAIPLRAAGAQLVQDLHPHDRGPKGTHDGAVISNGNLYCPRTPRTLPELGPLARTATKEQAADGNARPPSWPGTSSAASPPTTPTATTGCSAPPPWARSAARSRPPSMTLDRDRPEILQPAAAPPGLLHAADHHRPGGRARQDRAETRLPVRGPPPLLRPPHRRRTRLRHRQGPRHQRHQPRLVPPDGPDPADAVHTTLLIVRNQRILQAWNARQEENQRRATKGLPPKTRRRRRRTLASPPPDRPDPPTNQATAPTPARDTASMPGTRHARSHQQARTAHD